MTTESPEIPPLPQRGLLYLRGQGETRWVPHAGVPWLHETPTGLEIALADTLREGTRQERPGLVLLGHPGSGKTHALEYLASLCSDGNRPSILDLGRWRAEAGPVDEWLEERARSEGDGPSELLLVDSLDRLRPRDRRAATVWLRRAASDRRLVVACRHEGYEPDIELGESFLEVQLIPPRGAARSARPESPRAAAREAVSPPPPGTLRAPRGGYLLVPVPGGSFLMGSPDDEPGRWTDEGPRRRVDVSPFQLGQKPVTNGEFAFFLDARPSETEPGYWWDPRFNRDSQPVVGVSWSQARRYADWAGLRLPTEAEWEYACRASTSGERYGDLDHVAWHAGNSEGELHPVGTRAANAWGLFDMLGNAWEWVEDDHHPGYQGAPSDGRAWIEQPRGPSRLLRGGSWADNPRTLRAATRLTNHPGPRVGNVGFRLAADA